MSNQHLQNWYRGKRELTHEEKKWLDKLLSIDFSGRDILKNQINHAKVIGSCLCGCKTIDIHIERPSPRFPHPIRVPIEMIVYEDNSAPIIFYLHVIEGYVTELEVFKADSAEVKGISNLDNALISINFN